MDDSVNISVFRSYDDPRPIGEITLAEFCERTKSGYYKNSIESLRRITDKVKRDEIKATLPCFTISGTFSYRKAANIIQHSGVVCLDFDQGHNPDINDWPALRDSLAGIENVYFSSLSASGKGVFCIIPILQPEKHREQFIALQEDFEDMGLVIDKLCKDVTRLRGVSYDPDATMNLAADTYRKIFTPPPPRPFKTTGGSYQLDKLISWAEIEAPFMKGSRHDFLMRFVGACKRLGVPLGKCRSRCIQFIQEDFGEQEIQSIVNYIYN